MNIKIWTTICIGITEMQTLNKSQQISLIIPIEYTRTTQRPLEGITRSQSGLAGADFPEEGSALAQVTFKSCKCISVKQGSRRRLNYSQRNDPPRFGRRIAIKIKYHFQRFLWRHISEPREPFFLVLHSVMQMPTGVQHGGRTITQICGGDGTETETGTGIQTGTGTPPSQPARPAELFSSRIFCVLCFSPR